VRKTRGLLLLLGALLAVPAVRADPPAEPLQFEVTPFAGYRVGGKFELIDSGQSVDVQDHGSFALALNMQAGDGTQYELFYSRQATVMAAPGFAGSSVKVEYLHIGGIVPLDETPRVKPYLAGGLGVTRLSPDSAEGTDDTRFSLSLALGLRVPLSRHFSLRFEGRGFLTPFNTDTAIFCRSDQGGALCQVHASGSLFFQFDFLAGATYAF
jgi:opacity protein-like surface antigen